MIGVSPITAGTFYSSRACRCRPTWCPPGTRWYVDSNGTAWNSGEDGPEPGAVCRVPHRITCPGLSPEETGLWRWLDAVRAENARRARRKADEETGPGALPDAG
ncbi:DUF6083 domain-containing protein [Streptomyces massasporeus]|uniref:DUF6083 domain-containing protein n=1 Tax=Streptomyces massasporeus TaxID=67324 RepID=UPI003D9E383F